MKSSLHLSPPDRMALCRRVPLFRSLAENDLAMLAETAVIVKKAAGERLFAAGDPGHAAFIVVAGELLGALPDGQARARFSDGDFFGEYALFADRRRTLTVEAATECTLMELSYERLEILLHMRPGIALEMLRQAVAKIRDLEAAMAARGAAA